MRGCKSAYSKLFRKKLDARILDGIRECTNKAWVLGDEKFKRKITKQLDRAVESKEHGGDRRLKVFKFSTSLTP